MDSCLHRNPPPPVTQTDMTVDEYERECFRLASEEAKRNQGNPLAGLSYILVSHWHRKYREALESNQKKIQDNFFFVTINPSPLVTFHDFKLKVMKYFKQPGTELGFEIRKYEKGSYQGYHVHVILPRRRLKQDCGQLRRDIYNSFKDMVGNTKHIDVRMYPDSYKEDKRLYIKGEKWDEGKDESVALTKQWRLENKINDIYVI